MFYGCFPEFWSCVLEFSVLNVLVAIVKKRVSNHANAERVAVSCSCRKKTCCDVSSEGWEGKDLVMLYSLCGLAELLKHSKRIRNDLEIRSGRIRYTVTELVESLQNVCVTMSGDGVRWFASYALSFLGIFGFPSALMVKGSGKQLVRLVMQIQGSF